MDLSLFRSHRRVYQPLVDDKLNMFHQEVTKCFPLLFQFNFLLLNFPRFVFSGKYLRQKRIDFQLPYDILWLWKHDQVINRVEH